MLVIHFLALMHMNKTNTDEKLSYQGVSWYHGVCDVLFRSVFMHLLSLKHSVAKKAEQADPQEGELNLMEELTGGDLADVVGS